MSTRNDGKSPERTESAARARKLRRLTFYLAADLLLLGISHTAAAVGWQVNLGPMTVANYTRRDTGYPAGLSRHEYFYHESLRMAMCVRLGDWHWIVAGEL